VPTLLSTTAYASQKKKTTAYAIWSTGCCTNRVYRIKEESKSLDVIFNLDSFHNLLLNTIVAFMFRTMFIYDAPQIVHVDVIGERSSTCSDAIGYICMYTSVPYSFGLV